eukprot:4616209-Pleurochrysis_carterae.AAC.2
MAVRFLPLGNIENTHKHMHMVSRSAVRAQHNPLHGSHLPYEITCVPQLDVARTTTHKLQMRILTSPRYDEL